MELTTEQKILAAAQAVFLKKGYDGARMQEIAGEAGINKGLLHYYFKTKDTLFGAIFSAAFNSMVSQIVTILQQDVPVEERLFRVVDRYMALLMNNPDMPRFVVHELSKNPAGFINKHITGEAKTAFAGFSAAVKSEVRRKKIAPADPRQLFVDTISLIVFPFLARPLIQGITVSTAPEMKDLLAGRKEHIREAIRRQLRV